MLRSLMGGMMVVLSLPILAPLIAGTVITGAIHGVHALANRLRSHRHRDD